MKSKTKVRAQVETTTIALPKLALTPSVGRVKQKDVVSVKVEFEGLDEVSFAIEPRGAFSLDLNPMTRPGTLRLKGLADGTATLVASGKVGGAEAVRKLLHLHCEGPSVRILAYGYLPGDEE